jgi:hypothetical protein
VYILEYGVMRGFEICMSPRINRTVNSKRLQHSGNVGTVKESRYAHTISVENST